MDVDANEPCYITFLKLKDVGDPLDYIKLKSINVPLLEHAVKHELFQYVTNWKEFIVALKELDKYVYTKQLFGEDPKNVYKIRTSLASVVEHNDDTRIDFAIWAMFQIKNTLSYIPIQCIRNLVNQMGVDLEDVMSKLIQHPQYSQLYTSFDQNEQCRTIMHWLERAESFGVRFIEDGIDSGLDEHQNICVQHMLNKPYTVLQGIAGSGKTRTLSCVIKQIIFQQHVKVIAATFTHKAKLCIMDQLGVIDGVEIKTVHSLIASIMQSRDNGQYNDVFLVLDESSMLDLDLLAQLAQTMIMQCTQFQICFVGDCYQIPPVGRGEFFRWLIKRGKNVMELKKCYRTNKQDLYVTHMCIRDGKVPKTSDNFSIVYADDNKMLSSLIGKHINEKLNEYLIICWQNKHIRLINQWVQKALLQKGQIGPSHFQGFYVNDMVVYIGENVDNITNAMLGKVKTVTKRGLSIKWDNNSPASTYTNTSGLQLAYAISAHKSQGSEYKKVLVVMYDIEKMDACLDRRWMYTSVTRGKDKVIVFATKGVKAHIVKPLHAIPIENFSSMEDWND